MNESEESLEQLGDKVGKLKKKTEEGLSAWTPSFLKSDKEDEEDEDKDTRGDLLNRMKKTGKMIRRAGSGDSNDFEGSLPLFKYDDMPKDKFDGFSPSSKSYFLDKEGTKKSIRGRLHWSSVDEEENANLIRENLNLEENKTPLTRENVFINGSRVKRKFE